MGAEKEKRARVMGNGCIEGGMKGSRKLVRGRRQRRFKKATLVQSSYAGLLFSS